LIAELAIPSLAPFGDDLAVLWIDASLSFDALVMVAEFSKRMFL
jgi:hypothetical protein